jgi:ABC-2 type transport system ATP-binding protein
VIEADPWVPAAVSAEDISLIYGPHAGVFNVSLEIKNDICVLAGNNGAGKTTLLEMLQGLRTPESGTVQILGKNPITHRGEVTQYVGSALQGVTPYPTAKPRELLQYLAALYPRSHPPDQLMDQFSIPDARSVKTMSGGEIQRLKCAMALIGLPRIVFLDEPTAGLDPGGRADLYRVLRQQADEGIVMVVSTHLTEDIDSLSNRALVMKEGRLIADIRIQDLDKSESMLFRARPNLPIDQLLQALPHGITLKAIQPERYEVSASHPIDASIISIVAAWCAQHDTALEEISIGRSSLSSEVLQLLITDAHHSPKLGELG